MVEAAATVVVSCCLIFIFFIFIFIVVSPRWLQRANCIFFVIVVYSLGRWSSAGQGCKDIWLLEAANLRHGAAAVEDYWVGEGDALSLCLVILDW